MNHSARAANSARCGVRAASTKSRRRPSRITRTTRFMIVITTHAHAAHDPATMAPSPSGRPFYDRAERMDQLLGAVSRLGLPTAPAPDHGMAAIAAVHDAGYL